MTDQTNVRPRTGTTYRDLPLSPPIGDTPPAAPTPPPPPPPPAGPDPQRRRVWPWLAALALVAGVAAGVVLWSPWNGSEAAEDGPFSFDDGGSLFREGDRDFADPFPEDFEDGFGGPQDFFDQFGGPEDFFDQLIPEGSLDDPQRLFDLLEQFGLTGEGLGIPPDLAEEFGLPEDLLDRLRNGDLQGLLDQLPEGLRDRLESFEGFDRFGDRFRFNFSTDDFDLGYLPPGYEITSVRIESEGLRSEATRATIVAEGGDGEIEIMLLAGAAVDELTFPAGAEPVAMSGGDAVLISADGGRHTLLFSTGDVAGSIDAPDDVPVTELVRIAESVRHP